MQGSRHRTGWIARFKVKMPNKGGATASPAGGRVLTNTPAGDNDGIAVHRDSPNWQSQLRKHDTFLGRVAGRCIQRRTDEAPALYGIWRPKWAQNEHDFDVEIVSFGWADQNNVGNPNPITRRKLSVEQATNVKALIIALVEDVDVRRKISPFSSKTARFLGSIDFQDNWTFVEGLIEIEGQLPLS